jgi:hypothetical protein
MIFSFERELISLFLPQAQKPANPIYNSNRPFTDCKSRKALILPSSIRIEVWNSSVHPVTQTSSENVPKRDYR